MNITFMVVTVFFFGLIFLGKLIISGYVTYLLSVKFGDEYITSQMKRDTYIFGIVADLAAIGIVSLVLIILSNTTNISVIQIDGITFLQYYFCLFIYAIYPQYSYLGDDNQAFAESFYIILALIAVSLIASCIMYYFFVFRKSELSKPKKFYSVFILTITTAPYYFLFSFASFGSSMALL
ncbi:hypothetical protein [Ruminococcus sp.]|uniref:hypothetical protein n=1 Tax=Ruminococcus sp. TaxID=41978 RepID=UPI003FD8223F